MLVPCFSADEEEPLGPSLGEGNMASLPSSGFCCAPGPEEALCVLSHPFPTAIFGELMS